MNLRFKKIFSFFLAFNMLLSTFSFTVEKHYCGDFLVDISFVGDALNCGDQMQSDSSQMKKNCCKDEISKIEGQDKLQKKSFENISFRNQIFLHSFFSYLLTKSNINFKEETFYKDFSPPDFNPDIQALYQVYII